VRLKRQAASGAKWTTASTIGTSALHFVQLAVLARLLSPQDFGLMAMIMVVLGFAQAYADMGISKAIIYRQDATREQLSSLYWTNIMAGVAVFIIVFASIPLIVRFYNEPRLFSLLPWSALIFLITPVGHQFQILLQKELSFKPLAVIEISSAVAGAVTAVGSALAGLGVFSLILGQLANSTVKAFSLTGIGFRRWRPGLRFKKTDLKGYMSFGLYQMGEKSVNYFSANIDYIMIGKFLGADILGFYTLAYQLIIFPLKKINPILNRIAFPVFARVQNDDGLLRSGFLEVTKILSYISFPLLIGLGVTAPLFVPLVLGDAWLPSIGLVQILVLVGLFKTLGNPTGSVLLAKGRADIGFKWNVFVAAINTLVFYGAVQYGLYQVAWSYVILSFIYFCLFRFILKKVIGLTWGIYLKELMWPFFLSMGMGLLVFLFQITQFSFSKSTTLITQICCGVFIYLMMVLLFQKRYFIDLVKLFFQRNG
jgi:lipopolysaccharide exporter